MVFARPRHAGRAVPSVSTLSIANEFTAIPLSRTVVIAAALPLRSQVGKLEGEDEMVASTQGSPDPWAPDWWVSHFADRAGLRAELDVLARLFPIECQHIVRWSLLTVGGRTRLLDLAAELLRLPAEGRASTRDAAIGDAIPMQGRLRCAGLFRPTMSEFLVAPILRPLGTMVWQPQGARHGADYTVDCGSEILVAEVKRLCTSARERQRESERGLATMGLPNSPLFTREEEHRSRMEDAPRLYRRVRYAAKQLEVSAAAASADARRAGRSTCRTPGILFLDLDGHNLLPNLQPWLHGWMELEWASSIDLIVFYDYRPRHGIWGTIASVAFMRTTSALERLGCAHHICELGHLHIGGRLGAPCDLPFGF